MKEFKTHMFWAYGELSGLERLCMKSFVKNGYRLVLWSYGSIADVPDGVDLCDAREILPEGRIFTYENGSYSAVSNLFRYALMSRIGGLYVDTDVVALDGPHVLGERPFLVSQRIKPRGRWSGFLKRRLGLTPTFRCNPNVIFSPEPRPGDLIDLAHALADRYPVDRLEWGDCGPRLLTMLANAYPKLAFEIKPPEFANAIDFWNCPGFFLSQTQEIPRGAVFLHLFTEMWRRAGVDQNAAQQPGTLMHRLTAMYG